MRFHRGPASNIIEQPKIDCEGYFQNCSEDAAPAALPGCLSSAHPRRGAPGFFESRAIVRSDSGSIMCDA